MNLKVIVQRGEDRGFVVSVPALPGCWSQGATREDAIANIREAIEGWLEAAQDKYDRASLEGTLELVTV